MKARINLILCLLLIAITISLIAVSFGWYAAEAGTITIEDSSVTVQTAKNDFYYGGANFEFVATMSRESVNATTFNVHYSEADGNPLKHPYYGEDGIFSGEYILLIKMEKNGVDKENNPLSNNGYPYIQKVELTNGSETITTSYIDPTVDTEAYKADFQILYVSYIEGEKTANKIERDSNVTPEYIALIFGNGSSIFKYSSNQYFGYKFDIYIDYYNKQTVNN